MAYGRLMLDLAGTELTAAEQQLLHSPQVGGVILLGTQYQHQNVSPDEQTFLVEFR